MKKIFMAILTAIFLMPSAVWGESGTSTDGLSWDITDKVLTISGIGEMTETYTTYAPTRSPWYTYKSEITKIIVEEGVTTLGANAFYATTNCTEIELPSTLTAIGYQALYNCSTIVTLTIKATTPPTMTANFSGKYPAINNVPRNCKLCVPATSISLYSSAGGWSEFTNIQAIVDNPGGDPGPDPEPEPDPIYNKYECASIAALIAQETSDAADTCVLTANALVTYVSSSTVYIEDANSAICLKNVNPAPAVGDIISDIRGTKNGKILSLTKDISIVSNGNAVNAQTVAANILNANAEDYRYKFIKIKDVSFSSSGVKFYGTGSYKMTQNGIEIYMSAQGSALVGENIPSENVSILGFGSSDSFGFLLQAYAFETTEPEAPTELNADMNDEALEELNGSTINVLVNRNFTANMYNTICLPFAMSEGQINDVFGSTTRIFGMTGASLENDELVITFSTPLSSIAAGVPYLIWPENNITEPWQVDNVTITNVAQTNSNETIDFIGVLVPTMVEADHANLFVGANNKLHYNTASGNIQGMRAYFHVKDPKAVMAPARITRQTDTTTDIESTEDAMHAQKLLNEGRVIIRIEGHDYDLNGTMIR